MTRKSGWKSIPFNKAFRFSRGISLTKSDLTEEGIGVVNYGQIHSKANRPDVYNPDLTRFVPQELIPSLVCPLVDGDLVFADTSEDLAGVGSFVRFCGAETVYPGSHTFVASPQQEFLHRYFSYYLQSEIWRDQLRSRANGVKVFSITKDIIKGTTVLIPPIETQDRIVEFLDAELEQIDALTAEQERLVSLLIERRATVAEELVSRADSKEIRNRGIFRHVDRKSKTGEEELLSVSHITGVTPRSEKNVTMFEAESKIGYNLVEPGELVINTMWAWMGALGVSDFEGIVSPSYDIYEFIDRGEFCPEYFDMLYRTDRYIGLMKAHSRGIWESRLRLYPDVFLSLTSPVPSLKAQQQIAHEYHVNCAETDELLLKVQSLTSLLEERKQALITAAVTGELEV